MTNWTTLAGKFTDEELQVVRPFQKSLDLNDSQFVKSSILFMKFMVDSMLKLVESEEMKQLDAKYASLKEKISQQPVLADIPQAVEEMTDSMESALEKIVQENEPEMKKFTEKRKVGRPKNPKRKRGKPIDTGI